MIAVAKRVGSGVDAATLMFLENKAADLHRRLHTMDNRAGEHEALKVMEQKAADLKVQLRAVQKEVAAEDAEKRKSNKTKKR